MIIDYPPTTGMATFDSWLSKLVDELRFPDVIEAQTIEVIGTANIQNYNLGYIGGWEVTEDTLQNGTITLDAANNRIDVDEIVIDGGENEIRITSNIKLDADTDTITVNTITVDGGNDRIRSANYVAGYAGAGFSLSPELLEVGNIACRGIFRSAVFQKDVVSAIGGYLFVRPADVLATDMTAADASTLTIEGNETFAVGDFLRIKDGTDDEWFEVTNIGATPTYTVTRDKGADYDPNDNPVWKKGAAVVNFGQSGDGGISLDSTGGNAPYISMYTQGATPWSGVTIRLRIGNLNGFLGYSTDLYGIAIGETNKYLKYDPTNGLVVKGLISVDNLSAINADMGSITAGTITLDSSGFIRSSGKDDYADTTAGFFLGYDTDAYKFNLGDDTDYITWDGSQLTISGGTLSGVLAGEIIEASADTEQSTTSGSYVKLKEIIIGRTGTWRIYFGLRTATGGGLAYGRIYKDGVAHGTERSTANVIPDYWSEDLSFESGDLCQLYCYQTGGAVTAYPRNFRVKCLYPITCLVVLD